MSIETVAIDTAKLSPGFLPILKNHILFCRYYAAAHYRASQKVERTNIRFTIFLIFSSGFAVVLSGATWTSLIVTNIHWATAVRDLFGVMTVALASTQYALNFSEKAAFHKLAGAEFSKIRRDIEVMVDRLNHGSFVLESEWSHVGCQYGLITKFAPMVDTIIWNESVRKPLEKFRAPDGSLKADIFETSSTFTATGAP